MNFTLFLSAEDIEKPCFAVANSNLYSKRYEIQKFRSQLKKRSISEKRHITFSRLDYEVTEADSGSEKESKKSNTTTTSKKTYRSTTCKQKYQARR